MTTETPLYPDRPWIKAKDQRIKNAIKSLREQLRSVCQEQVDLEMERRRLKGQLLLHGSHVLRRFDHLTLAVREIVTIHPLGIHTKEITKMLKREGFDARRKEFSVSLANQVVNLCFIFWKRGIFRKIALATYVPSNIDTEEDQ